VIDEDTVKGLGDKITADTPIIDSCAANESFRDL
jgi:hypothetical protein